MGSIPRLFQLHRLFYLALVATSMGIVAGPVWAQDVVGAEPTVEPAPAEPAVETAPAESAEEVPAVEETAPVEGPAPASEADALELGELKASTRFQAGVNLRTDLGTHPLRLDAALRLGDVDLIAVIDPMAMADGQFDGDLVLGWRPFGFPWAALLGWRTTTIGLEGGTQMQQRLLLGVAADLPSIFDAIHASWGMEMAAVLARHGAGLPTETIGFASGRHYIDYLNFGMFLRIHFDAQVGEGS